MATGDIDAATSAHVPAPTPETGAGVGAGAGSVASDAARSHVDAWTADGMATGLTAEHVAAFQRDGCVVVRGVLSAGAVARVREALADGSGIVSHAFERDDGSGLRSKMALWNQPGDDLTGMVARAENTAGAMAQLLGGEVYHYHTKAILKEAHTGGKFVWHQDYGYWYQNGCLYPDMGTVMIAVDECTKANGCLQVIKGSHKLGRIAHVRVGGQVGADMKRVDAVLARPEFRVESVPLSPGDALFFHCNVLHTSAQNRSPDRRYCLLVAYNRASNNPVYEHHHPQYKRLHVVPSDAVLGAPLWKGPEGKDFMVPVTKTGDDGVLREVTELWQQEARGTTAST